ncbi:MFS transporter [Planococcus lenghuensis]|uniref:Major facilitator superfamily (MFS) profile domain-containing protein n=1 Tax=Planococcus lenghuensis TaxID=2213202 RepID=A0A1Q2L492_9BACL|nr:MFS transporter [Planococcus lenghuensis]AQQ55246.1 hypothetical protein B0X71_18865 [Planococcus lenghuensis]
MNKTPEVKAHVLKNRPFAFLWIGQSISLFGLAIYATCLPFLVFHAGGGAVELGFAHSFFIIPQLVFLLISGVFVDRWPRKIILLICDVIRGMAVAGITLLLVMGSLKLPHVYALTGLLGLISTFYRPAVRGIIPQLVAKNQLISANSLRSISQQLSEMIGPVVAGALVVNIGLYAAYGINTATFLLSALLVSAVAVSQARKRIAVDENDKTSFWNDFRDGWLALKKREWLGASILIGSLSNIGIASFDVIILPVFANEFYAGVLTYSWVLSSMAVGALVCAVIIGKIDRMAHRGILYYAFMSLSGIGILLLSFKPELWLLLLLTAMIGFSLTAFIIIWDSASLTAFIIIWDSAIQELVEEDVLGRITSFQMFGGLVLLPVSYWIFGLIIENFGTTSSMAISGISIVLVSVAGLTNRKIRNLN